MPLQNRVDPFGQIHAVAERGALMGNRGILHDDAQQIRRSHAHQNWVTCALAFKERKRELMAPHRYTELFFLDEATAFAAGHRPCAECRRARYREFVEYWKAAHGEAPAGVPLPKWIDRVLHAHRIARGAVKVSYPGRAEDLPSGTIFALGTQPVMIRDGRQFDWHFGGYRARPTPVRGEVSVLTPRPVVALFRAGFRPQVDASATG